MGHLSQVHVVELLEHVLQLVGDELNEIRTVRASDLHVRPAQTAMLPCESRYRLRVARGSEGPDRNGDHEAGRAGQPDQLSSKGQRSTTHLAHDGLERLFNLQRRERNRAGPDSLARFRALSVRVSRARDHDDCNRDEASE